MVGSATYLMYNADSQVQGALRCMRALEEVHLRVTPITKAREVLERHGIPNDVIKWVRADPEAPGPKKSAAMLRVRQMFALRRRLEAKVVHGVYAR